MAKVVEKSAVHGLNYPARALCSVVGETDQNQFLVGTMTLRRENEVHLLEYNEDDHEISSTIFRHPLGEVWSLASCPSRPDLFFSCYNAVEEAGSEMKATLWKIDSKHGQGKDHPMTPVVTLPAHSERLQGVFWEPEKLGRVISLDESHIRIWNLDSHLAVKAADSITVSLGEKKGSAKLRTMAWNPHAANNIATVNDCALRGWDLRSLRQTFTIDGAHTLSVRDVDFNPNKPHQLVSCGDDCKVKFWDIRHPEKPLKTLSRHSHWVWRVLYNRFHDQLVLSSSSDSLVNLENVVSISSVVSLSGDSEDSHESAEKQTDGLVASYDQHEDSVYSIAWSAADPWIFASVSYDGRVVINSVPREEKFKIIL